MHLLTATLPLVKEAGGQRVVLRHVSNRLFPNRTGQFLSIRLSRDVAPPVLGLRGIHRTRWVLSTFPCGPSPCPGHYPRHSSTMATPSPYGSRRVGDPAVLFCTSSVRRCPIGWFPRSFRALTGEAFPHPASLAVEPCTSPIRTMMVGVWGQDQLI